MRNYELTLRSDFAVILSAALARLKPNQLRIHVSGDFYSADYLNAWLYALKQNTHLKPFAFTRSWRVEAIARLIRLTKPHWLFASVDEEANAAPEFMKTAKMELQVRAKVGVKNPTPNPALRFVPNICTEQLAPDKVNCRSCGRCPGFKISLSGIINAVKQRDVVFAGH
jgi:hypothetical protein